MSVWAKEFVGTSRLAYMRILGEGSPTMRIMMLATVTVLTLSLVFTLTAVCDTVVLNNGNTVHGRAVSEKDGTVQLDMPFGNVQFSREEVQNIEQDASEYVVKERQTSGKSQDQRSGTSAAARQTAALPEGAKQGMPAQETAKLDQLISALNGDDVKLVDKAYDNLVASGKQAVPYLMSVLDKASPLEAPHIMAALYTIDREKAFKAVSAKITHDDSTVRQAAVTLLGEMSDSRATKVLVNALSDKKYEVRREAATGLGKIRDSAAIPALITATDDNDPDVSRAAHDALRAITKKEFGSRGAWEQWWSHRQRRTTGAKGGSKE